MTSTLDHAHYFLAYVKGKKTRRLLDQNFQLNGQPQKLSLRLNDSVRLLGRDSRTVMTIHVYTVNSKMGG